MTWFRISVTKTPNPIGRAKWILLVMIDGKPHPDSGTYWPTRRTAWRAGQIILERVLS